MRPSIISSGLFEELESRRLLSGASIDASGTLLVSGSRARDRIAITLSPADPTKLNVVINGHLQTFDVAAITNGVKFFGKAGNDRINVLQGVVMIFAVVEIGRARRR